MAPATRYANPLLELRSLKSKAAPRVEHRVSGVGAVRL